VEADDGTVIRYVGPLGLKLGSIFVPLSWEIIKFQMEKATPFGGGFPVYFRIRLRKES
jgi:hypothetical protein